MTPTQRKQRTRRAFGLILAFGISGAVQAQTARDPDIDALIARMTIEEKAGQLTILSDVSSAATAAVNPEFKRRKVDAMLSEIRAGRVGALISGNGANAARDTQRMVMRRSRLKIPLLFAADVIHGFRVVFPIPLGEAASFEPDLAYRTSRVAAIEATAAGLQWTFAPMVDIARDQRWGRVAEGAGEDVYLGKLFAAARVHGFQGDDLKSERSLLATPKHFAAYGAVAAGMDYNTVEISEQTLREVHFPPFKAAFDAGALSTMSSFNDINGVPATGNRWLLTQVLRDEWGFDGFVVSDYTADHELILHGYAADDAQAAQLSLSAGVDMSMQSGVYVSELPKLVQSGRLPMSVVDEAVRRVLRVKKALGLFENPYRSLDPQREATDIDTPAHRALARDAGRRSAVLLRNERKLLPLAKSTRIALIGPLGDDRNNLHGPWTIFGREQDSITLKQGLERAGATIASVATGSDIEFALDGGIEAAVAAAKAADVIVLAIGEGEDMSGEAQSRTQIIVPDAQRKLAEAVAGLGKPVVVVLSTGRALALEGAVRDADAVLVTWFLGSESGTAIADILFGDFNPSGRLPVSFPRDSGQQPFFYNHRRTGRPFTDMEKPEYTARYREVPNTPLYPFGHGLSYTTFEYSAAAVSAPKLVWDGKVTVSARVTNTGTRAGEEVVQLYVHDRVASITRPVRELKGFRKLAMQPGQSVEVKFELTRRDLEFVGLDKGWIAEPGEFAVWIAPSSDVAFESAAKFELEGQ
jgi:beta-glucosidase